MTPVDPSETSRMEELIEFFETSKQKQFDYAFYDDCWTEDRITPFTINPDWTKVQVHRNIDTDSLVLIYRIGLLPDELGTNTLSRSTHLVLKDDLANGIICAALVLKEWELTFHTNYDYFSGGIVYIDESGGYSDLAWFNEGTFDRWFSIDEDKLLECAQIEGRDPKCPKWGKSWFQRLLGSIVSWFKDGGPNQNSSGGSSSSTGGWSGGSFLWGNPFSGSNTNSGNISGSGSGSGTGTGNNGGTNDGALYVDAITNLYIVAQELSDCNQFTLEQVLQSIASQFPGINISESTSGYLPEGSDPFITYFMYNVGQAFEYADQQTVMQLLEFVNSLSCMNSSIDSNSTSNEESACLRNIREFEINYGLSLTRPEILLLKSVDPCGSDGFDEEEALRILLNIIGIEDIDFAISDPDIVQWIFDFIGNNSGGQKLEYANTLLKLKKEDNDINLERGEELYINIIENNDFLLEDCLPSNLNPLNYADLFNHQLPQECNDVLDALGDDFYYQPIDDAHSPSINFDHYSVEITVRPDINGDQQPDSDEEIFEAIKLGFLSLASGTHQNFDSECALAPSSDVSWDFLDYPGFQPTSTDQWTGPSPIGTVFFIDADGEGIAGLVADDGAVIVSDYQDCCWVFSTIVTEASDSQPFSGHRQFGIRTTPNGLEFFTRATDRAKLTSFMKSLLNDACSYQDYFNIGDITWTNLMNSVKSLTESHGGAASITSTDYIRPNYKDIIEYLKSDVPLQINCD